MGSNHENHPVSRSNRPRQRSRRLAGGRRGRIPAWLFYLVIGLAALGALVLMGYAVLNPAVPEALQ